MNEYNDLKAKFTEVLEKLIELKYITVNEYISHDGIASFFANGLAELESDKQKFQDMQQLFRLLDKHKPDKIEAVFGKPKKL